MPDRVCTEKADRFRSAPSARTGTGTSVLDSAAECSEAQQQQGFRPHQYFSRSKKRTGLGPQSLPGLGPGTSVLDCAAECSEANSSKVPSAVSASSHSKKRTGFGPHLCPQIRGISQGYWGYVRSSELTNYPITGPVFSGPH